MCILNIFSSCSLDVDNVSENGSPPNHASSHLLPNTSLIPKTLNRSSNSVNSHTSVPLFTVQSSTHTSASPVQSPSHVSPSITSPVKPTFTHSSVSPVQSPSHSSSIATPVKPTIQTSSSVSPIQSPSHTHSVTSPVKPSTHSHSSVSPVQSPSHTRSVTSPVKPSTHSHSSVSPVQSPSHTRSVTSPVKPSTHSHSSVSTACCKPPLATDSALTTSNRHVNVREAADKEYRKNVERMKTQYAKRKQHQCNTYCAGDSVTVRVPTNERSSTDMPRLLCYVAEVRHDLYQLQ